MAPITNDLAALADERLREAHGRADRRRLAQDSAAGPAQHGWAVAGGAPVRVPGGLAELIGRVPALQAWR
jgi:hypothetical protein